MIDIGGEIRAQGRNARGEPWHIAIEHPVDTQRTPFASVRLDGASVSTSGEYRDYYERDGRRYSHTIDPRTATAARSPAGLGRGHRAADGPGGRLGDGAERARPREALALATQRHMPVLFIEREGDAWRSQATPEFERYRDAGESD